MTPELAKLPDYMDKHGAGVLAAHIEAYWKAKGYSGIVAKRFEVSPGHYGVWSNMVNGIPPSNNGAARFIAGYEDGSIGLL